MTVKNGLMINMRKNAEIKLLKSEQKKKGIDNATLQDLHPSNHVAYRHCDRIEIRGKEPQGQLKELPSPLQ